ncbi:MAG: BPSS1780 family membrane protein [Candidatus Dactylopiibacterium sp.]|nr:BPSS1780 family membrane protein [Candidatus Dactylopiibacterium sp.]
MQARRFPASQGWVWLKQGFALWRRAPIVLTGACLTMFMLLLVSAILPVLGQVLPALLLPPLGVGMFLLCGEIRRQGTPSPGFLFQGFRLNLPRQFAIGAMRLVGQLLCMLAAAKLSGLDPSTPLGKLSSDGTVLQIVPQFRSFVTWFAALGLPLELCFWFSPQLVALGGVSPFKSVFFSVIACWRNLPAIVVCLVAWAVLFGLLPAFVMNLIGAALPALSALLIAPLMLVMMPVFYASFHASATDIFGETLRT